MRVIEPVVKSSLDLTLGWFRVAEDDGSTVAYTPDRITADLIRKVLVEHETRMQKESCPTCKGTGQLYWREDAKWDECDVCGGTGR